MGATNIIANTYNRTILASTIRKKITSYGEEAPTLTFPSTNTGLEETILTNFNRIFEESYLLVVESDFFNDESDFKYFQKEQLAQAICRRMLQVESRKLPLKKVVKISKNITSMLYAPRAANDEYTSRAENQDFSSLESSLFNQEKVLYALHCNIDKLAYTIFQTNEYFDDIDCERYDVMVEHYNHLLRQYEDGINKANELSASLQKCGY
ncbi:hypothetical protein RGQ13_01700 [Thalassotalea psychrophila]|uniref:Orphan protein n=1 Tax=Thalassotalea psychrophila TaxID=3065647 RepID=A0ABY9TV52_9GAMM|nr:hypothetical protein RGQ13_01700 [Colwelliaceae bacterium SQ149]